ncbi:MAG TPA: 4-hydroxythreonine-4-phosphate dehydrogenase PdxA [Macromonas sp.]|nr:4-hydroxythreonine-4-phosphate dehydrogenase PdxA [Macromonas sp.]
MSQTSHTPIPPLPIAITMGDPAGIGPEIIAAAFRQRPAWARRCFVVGDIDVMRRAAQLMGQPLPVAVIEQPHDVAGLPVPCLPVLPAVRLAQPVQWGRIQAHAGQAAADAIAWAARAALRGEVGAVVTAPIHKEALSAAGLPYPGHTEYLQALAAEARGCSVSELPVRMMLSNDELRTVLVSIHVSLRQAIEAVTFDNVLQTMRITDRHFRQLGGRAMRIAVAGLNPHAGEGGLFGREETDVIAPAIEQARAEGLLASGPHAPDTVFMRARQGEFDVVVAMYHDQGLIPVKYLGLEHGVNTTLGLPFVRTSPDHGTAFDLAGTGRADPSSLMAAVEAAMAAQV